MNTETIQRAIDAIKKERPDYGPIMDAFGRIIIKQAESLSEVEVEPVAITKDAAQAKLEKGTPLLSDEDFQIDLSSASRLFKEVCEILKSGGQPGDEALPFGAQAEQLVAQTLERGWPGLERVEAQDHAPHAPVGADHLHQRLHLLQADLGGE